MAGSSKLNGSVNMLADAMRRVFTEAVQEGVKPVKDAVDDLKENMVTKAELRDGLKTTDENVQAQLAQNRRDISEDVKSVVADGK